MTCLSCEKRREWIKQQYEQAKESWRRLINRDSKHIASSDDRSEPNDVVDDASNGNPEPAIDLNRGSEQSINESGSESG
ncbi:hypothetical protein [Acinetobacter guerrae]|uniref:hypothetical protein n=1 Tax=Acinetobacter guerrae TaxID=1843371 RepID=UPI00125FA714|nr:hypothetical protein [Acinetobacter guerrae]